MISTITQLTILAVYLTVTSNPADRVEQLVVALSDDNVKKREEADLELERICLSSTRPKASSERRAVATALTKALERDDLPPFTKQRLLQLIGQIGSYESVRPVTKFLGDTNPDIRRAALHALESNPTVPAVRALVSSLDDAEGELKTALIQSLGRRRYSLAVGPIMEVARSSKGALRLTALRALAEIGARSSLDVLVETLERSNNDERDELLEVYVRYAYRLKEEANGGAARRIFIDIVKYGGRWRVTGLLGIGRMGVRLEVPTIVEALGDGGLAVRAAAIEALASLRGGLKTVLARLVDASPQLTIQLLDVLGRRRDARGKDNVVTAIVESSSEGAVDLKTAAITALRRLGGPESIRRILVELDNSNDAIRGKAARALADPKLVGAGDFVAEAFRTASSSQKKALLVGILGWRGDHIEIIRAAAGDATPALRHAAYRALGHTISGDNESQKILLAAVDHETGTLREIALAALSSFDDTETTAALVRLAESKSIPVATRAKITSRLSDRADQPEVLAALVRASESPEPRTMLAGLSALGDTLNRAALPVLLDAVRRRSGSAKAIAALGSLRLARIEEGREPDKAAAVYLELLKLDADDETKHQCLSRLRRLRVDADETK